MFKTRFAISNKLQSGPPGGEGGQLGRFAPGGTSSREGLPQYTDEFISFIFQMKIK